MANGTYMMRLLANLNSKYVQPGFEFKHAIIKPKSYYDPSILHLKFCNGYERKYNLGLTSWRHIKFDIEEVNRHVEFERALQGQDDELEDE